LEKMMSSIDPTQFYVGEFRYWHAVYATLCEIFGMPSKEARRLIDTYRGQLWEEAEPLERLLTFHAEPLDVASDLAGVEHLTVSHANAYDKLMRGRRESQPVPEVETTRNA
jgi:hypothetical protein